MDKNTLGTRSNFVTELLQKQLGTELTKEDLKTEIPTTMSKIEEQQQPSWQVSITDNNGIVIGRFNVKTNEDIQRAFEKITILTGPSPEQIKTQKWFEKHKAI
jgi:hypothetical protein